MISVIGDSFTSGVGYTPWCDLLQQKLNKKVVNLNRQNMLCEPYVTSTNSFMMDRLEEFEMILQVSDLFIFQWSAPLRDDEDIQGDYTSVVEPTELDKREIKLLNRIDRRLDALSFNCPMIFWSWRDFSHHHLDWYDKHDCGIRWTNDPNLIIGKHDPHPNQDGHEWISEKILSFIKNKNYLY